MNPTQSMPTPPIPMPAFLEGNPYFSAGFGLALMGMGFSLLRYGSMGAALLAQRRCLVTLEITNRDPAYDWVLLWLNRTTRTKARRVSIETARRETQSGRSITSFSFVPSQGKHFIRYQNRWMMVDRDREVRASGNREFEKIKFTSVGWSTDIYNDLIEEAHELATRRDRQHTTIFTSYGYNGWKQFGNPRHKRELNSVILDGMISRSIVNDVEEFLDSREWYHSRGIPYRRGYLLYGEPGSGKTSFVTALAGHLDYDIAVMSLAQPNLTDDHLAVSMINVPERCLILFEDVDCLFGDRSSSDNLMSEMIGEGHDNYSSENLLSGGTLPPKRSDNYITFSGFLNALDGVSAGEERIAFLTTNHVHKLDPALIRPGRVDVIHQLGAASESQIACLFVQFFPEFDTPDRLQSVRDFAKALFPHRVSMAELQGYLLLHKDTPQTALDDVTLFVESLINSPRRMNQMKAQAK